MSIPLGVFRYIKNIPKATAEFMYQEFTQICKPPRIQYLEEIDKEVFQTKNKLIKLDSNLLSIYKYENILLKSHMDSIDIDSSKLLSQYNPREINKIQDRALEPFMESINCSKYKMLREVDIAQLNQYFNKLSEVPKTVPISKYITKMLKEHDVHGVSKYITKVLRPPIVENINKSTQKLLNNFIPEISLMANKLLNNLDKDSGVNIYTNKSLGNLEDWLQISRDYSVSLTSEEFGLTKDYNKSLDTFIEQIDKSGDKLLGSFMENLNYNKDFKSLETWIKNIYKTKDKLLSNNYIPELYYSQKNKLLIRNNFHTLYHGVDNIYMARLNMKDMYKSKNTPMLKTSNIHTIYYNSIYGLANYSGFELSKPNHTTLLNSLNVYGCLNYKLKPLRMFINNLSGVLINNHIKLLKRENISRILIRDSACYLHRIARMEKIVMINQMKLLKSINIEQISKIPTEQYLNKIRLIHTCRIHDRYLERMVISQILIEKIEFMNVLNIKDIIPSKSMYLNPTFMLPIFKNHKIVDLKITKRFWIVSPALGEDTKILPPDYDYENLPLIGNSLLGYLQLKSKDSIDKAIIEVEKPLIDIIHDTPPYSYRPILYENHPNSPQINKYIDHDDTYRGMEEIPLAINIMVEIVNIVGLIVHHSGSQLCYCTGQEAMWFIMDLLDGWLSMESTQQELREHNATEHYYRAYRWVRWEAEKVFFNCDTDPTRFQGLKYAMQLFGNLIQYMNQHHYDPGTILWKDLTHMDYWRNQSNRDNNPQDDFIILPHKIKGKRHYNINTQARDIPIKRR